MRKKSQILHKNDGPIRCCDSQPIAKRTIQLYERKIILYLCTKHKNEPAFYYPEIKIWDEMLGSNMDWAVSVDDSINLAKLKSKLDNNETKIERCCDAPPVVRKYFRNADGSVRVIEVCKELKNNPLFNDPRVLIKEEPVE